MALSYNLLHSTIIHKITATAATVLGEMKVVVVLLLSAAFLGKLSLSYGHMARRDAQPPSLSHFCRRIWFNRKMPASEIR